MSAGPRRIRAVQVLAVLAALLATGALLADTIGTGARAGAPGATVAAIELARWLRAGRESLRLIDVRDSVSFSKYHIAMAENVPPDRLPDARFGEQQRIVVYSDGEAEAASVQAMLLARGIRNTLLLRGGLAGWIECHHGAGIAESRECGGQCGISRNCGAQPLVRRHATHGVSGRQHGANIVACHEIRGRSRGPCPCGGSATQGLLSLT